MGSISPPKPSHATRFADKRQDVWALINQAAANSPVKPVVNMGQGFFGYNPPDFMIDAAKGALDRVDCNQYAPTQGRMRLKEAIAQTYGPLLGQQLDPKTEVAVTTGANEGMLSAFMAFIEPGDEVIIFEPYFDQYLYNIRMPGGVIKYVPLHPPEKSMTDTCSASEWTVDMAELEKTITSRTKMIVINTPHNPVGKIFSEKELRAIGELCVKHNIIILSDEVYDRLDYNAPHTRIATLSPEIARLTLTVGSAGKHFFCTGWRVGFVIGPAEMIDFIMFAHTKICYSTPSPFQEAAAIAYESSISNGFWESTSKDMKGKMDRFCELFKELGLPYTVPDGGYFVLANMAKVHLPADYKFPPHIESRRRDFKLAWFLITELGVAAIPPTEFYIPEHEHLGENFMRFSVCQNNDVLEKAKERLRGLKPYIK